MSFIINPFTGKLDANGSAGSSDHATLSHLAYADSGHTGFQPAGSYLTLDQSTPQHVTSGKPYFDDGILFGSTGKAEIAYSFAVYDILSYRMTVDSGETRFLGGSSLTDGAYIAITGENSASSTGKQSIFNLIKNDADSSYAIWRRTHAFGDTYQQLFGLAGSTGLGTFYYGLADDTLTASKVVFTSAAKRLTSTGIGTSSQFIKGDGSLDSLAYLTSYTETDPVVKAINGIVKSNGTTISAAAVGTDYDNYLTRTGTVLTPRTAGDAFSTATGYVLGGNIKLTGSTIQHDAASPADLNIENLNIDADINFRTTSNTTLYTFNVTGVSGTPVVGELYTDSSTVTFSVYSWSLSSGAGTVVMRGSAPTSYASGTLYRGGGTGPATLVYSSFTYTPTRAWISIRDRGMLYFDFLDRYMGTSEPAVEFTGTVYPSIVGYMFYNHPTKTASDALILFGNAIVSSSLTGNNYIETFREASNHSSAQVSDSSDITGFNFMSNFYRGSTTVATKSQLSTGLKFAPAGYSTGLQGGTSTYECAVNATSSAGIRGHASAATSTVTTYGLYRDSSIVGGSGYGDIVDVGVNLIGGTAQYLDGTAIQYGIKLIDYGYDYNGDSDGITDQCAILVTTNAGTSTGDIILEGDDAEDGITRASMIFGAGRDADFHYDGTDLVLDTAKVGSGVLKFKASSNWTANGTATVTISNVAPAGVGTATISKWLTVKDNAGTVYYIPAWT